MFPACFLDNQRGGTGGRHGRPAFLSQAKGLSVKAWPQERKAWPAAAFNTVNPSPLQRVSLRVVFLALQLIKLLSTITRHRCKLCF